MQSSDTICLIDEVIRVVTQNPLGVFCTIDAAHVPHPRYMTAVVDDEIENIYTLSGANARKIDHLRVHPTVAWMFNSFGQEDVVTFYGHASVLTESSTMSLWDKLTEAAKPYAMTAMTNHDSAAFAVVHTRIERCEFLSPRLAILRPTAVALR